jgi:hypothetical protein
MPNGAELQNILLFMQPDEFVAGMMESAPGYSSSASVCGMEVQVSWEVSVRSVEDPDHAIRLAVLRQRRQDESKQATAENKAGISELRTDGPGR